MTNEELEIGAKWMAILNAYSSDFGTKSLFNQTAAYLKAKHNGNGKRVSKFQKETKLNTNIDTGKVTAPKPTIGLLEAAKLREAQMEQEGDGNLLAIDETDQYAEIKTMKKGKKNV